METKAVVAVRTGCAPRCPACAHRGLAPEESLARKSAWLHRQLAPWADRLAPVRAVEPDRWWSYRDKVCLSCAWSEGGWQIGVVARKSLVPIPACPVHSARVRRAVQLLATALPPGPEFPLVYYVQSGAQVTLVLKSARMPDLAWLAASVRRGLTEIGVEGLWLHLHPAAGRQVFAKRGWHLVWGEARSRDAIGLLYGPAAFQQLIPDLYACALDEAEAFLAPEAGEGVADLYCGSGSSLVRWGARGADVIGVELGGEAVACAALNAPDALVLRGQCRDRIPQLDQWLDARAGSRVVCYANPPRTGLEPEVAAWIAARPFARLAYLSCSAGTLRRDLDLLVRGGFEVARITPYDFFPQTLHVETLALLHRG